MVHELISVNVGKLIWKIGRIYFKLLILSVIMTILLIVGAGIFAPEVVVPDEIKSSLVRAIIIIVGVLFIIWFRSLKGEYTIL